LILYLILYLLQQSACIGFTAFFIPNFSFMKKIYTLCLLSLITTLLWSQKAGIFDIFYEENRLSTLKIHNDTLWAGTPASLVKRLLPNGEVLEVWNGNNSPLDKPITDIAVSIKGDQIAMTHQKFGLTLKMGSQWRNWSAAEIMGTVAGPSASIWYVGFDKENLLWALGNDYKLRYLDNNKWIIPEAFNPNQYFSQVYNDVFGNFFGVTYNKVTKFEKNKQITYQSPDNEHFCHAVFDPNGHLFVFTEKGNLLKYTSPNTYALISLSGLGLPTYVSCHKTRLMMNGVGDVIILTDKKYYKRKMNGETEIKSLPASWFTNSILPNICTADADGNIWHNSKSNNILQKITKDIAQLDAPLSGMIRGNNINMEHGSPYFWVSFLGYLNRIHINDREKNEHYFYNQQYYAYFAPTGQPNQMWIASIDGLQLYDNGQFIKIPEAVANEDKRMFSILTLKDGKVMGSGQLNKKLVIKIYDPRSSSWAYHEYGQEGLPAYFSLTAYCKDPKGDVWIAYENGFLNHKNNSWDSIRFKDTGLPFKYPNNFSITADGDMWTTRIDTILRFDQREWTLNHFLECPQLVFGFSSGIRHLFTDSKGRLWASGGCNEPRLNMYDGQQWHYLDTTNTNLPKDFFLNQIAEDIQGDLWILASPMVRLRTKDLEVWLQKQQKGHLHIWPNPATDGFSINIPKNASGHIELMDVQGRILQRKKVLNNGEDVFFERGSLPNGFYFIRLQNLSGRVWVQKVILH
jgi:hypothetical protein